MKLVTLQNISVYLFLISIVLFKLPYIYLLPGVHNAFLTSQALARILLISSFVSGLLVYKKNNTNISKETKVVHILVLYFFAVSSLSIIYSQNLEAFLTRYKDFLISILAFYAFSLFKKEEKKITLVLIVTIPVMIVYQLILLYGNELAEIMKSLLYQRHLDIVAYNLSRGRIYVDVFDEAFIPMIFVLFGLKSKEKSFLSFSLVIALSFLALISNSRTRILTLLFGIMGLFTVLAREHIKYLLFLIIIMVSAIVIVISTFSLYSSKLNFLDRFLLTDNIEDVVPIYARFDQIRTAFPMGFVSPLGVGLGNYYDNLPNNRIKSLLPPDPGVVSAREYIHNNLATIIAESGYIAFLFYIGLLVLFIKRDMKIIRQKNYYKRCFILAFWSLFFYGFFNPPIPVSYQVLFWGMRGLLTT